MIILNLNGSKEKSLWDNVELTEKVRKTIP